MNQEVQQELARRELSRRRLLDFIKYNFEGYEANWHHRKIVDALERVERGELDRLMIQMPPGHGKSEISSIQFPAWYLGRNPQKQIIAVSYNAELAVDFGKKTRNLVRRREFGNVFQGIKLSEDSTAAGKWNTNLGVSYIATGMGGAVTGRRADVLIIDDPVKSMEEVNSDVMRESIWQWYRSVARTRLNPGGSIVIIQTRWHEEDLSGKILEGGAEGWEVIKFPAIAENDEEFRKAGEALWPERYPLDVLETTKKDIGPYEWSSLYQQNPVDVGAQVFKRVWFLPITQREVDLMQTRKILTIDTAISQKSSADYTGFCDNSINQENFWHLRAWRERINPHDLIERLFALYLTRKYHKIGIEKTIYLDVLKGYIESEQRIR